MSAPGTPKVRKVLRPNRNRARQQAAEAAELFAASEGGTFRRSGRRGRRLWRGPPPVFSEALNGPQGSRYPSATVAVPVGLRSLPRRLSQCRTSAYSGVEVG